MSACWKQSEYIEELDSSDSMLLNQESGTSLQAYVLAEQ